MNAFRETVLGKKAIGYAITLNNIVMVYIKSGQYKESLPDLSRALDECLRIFQAEKGPIRAEYLGALNNRAALWQFEGKYEDALKVYTAILAINKNIIGTNHPDYGTTLNNIGLQLYFLRRYEEAELRFLEAQAIAKVALGTTHENYALASESLARIYQITGQYSKAVWQLKETYTSFQQQLVQFLSFSSQQQQANYVDAHNSKFTYGYSFALRHHRQQPDLAG
ncbi:hypothetical protein GCM10028805_19900 [Spirosoma harenae]